MSHRTERQEIRLRVEAIRDFQILLQYESNWGTLIREIAEPSLNLTFEWMTTWWKCHNKDGRELFVIAVFENEALIALAPLQIVKKRIFGIPFRSIEFLSMADYADHPSNCASSLDFIISRRYDEVVELILDQLSKHSKLWHCVRLHPIPANSRTLKNVEKTSIAKGFQFTRSHVINNSYLHIPDNWESYFGTLSRRFRKDLMSSEKDLKREGNVEYNEYRSLDESRNVFDLILKIEKRSWKWDKGIAINSIVYNDFYRSILEACAARDWLRLWILSLDGEPIAYDLCIEFNGSIEALKKGYVEAYKGLYPGGVLEWRMLEQFVKNGVRSVNFQWGDIAHKSNWSTVLEAYDEIFIFQKKFYSRLVQFILFSLSLYSLSPIVTGFYRRIFRKYGIISKHSELTRMDQLV